MTDPYSIIVRPVVTEKGTVLAQAPRPRSDFTLNQYTFEVTPQSTKGQIKQAVEQWWFETRRVRIKVTSVNTMTVRPKWRRTHGRQTYGRTRRWKKAVVTLQDGDSLDIY